MVNNALSGLIVILAVNAALLSCIDDESSDPLLEQGIYQVALSQPQPQQTRWCLGIKSQGFDSNSLGAGAAVFSCDLGVAESDQYLLRWKIEPGSDTLVRAELLDATGATTGGCLGARAPLPEPGSSGEGAGVFACLEKDADERQPQDWLPTKLATGAFQLRLGADESQNWCLGLVNGAPDAGSLGVLAAVVPCMADGVETGPDSQNWILTKQ